jgi:hypothetical protein
MRHLGIGLVLLRCRRAATCKTTSRQYGRSNPRHASNLGANINRESAVASFLSPDSADRLEAAFARRLDRLSRQSERLEYNLAIAAENVGFVVRTGSGGGPRSRPVDPTKTASWRMAWVGRSRESWRASVSDCQAEKETAALAGNQSRGDGRDEYVLGQKTPRPRPPLWRQLNKQLVRLVNRPQVFIEIRECNRDSLTNRKADTRAFELVAEMEKAIRHFGCIPPTYCDQIDCAVWSHLFESGARWPCQVCPSPAGAGQRSSNAHRKRAWMALVATQVNDQALPRATPHEAATR